MDRQKIWTFYKVLNISLESFLNDKGKNVRNYPKTFYMQILLIITFFIILTIHVTQAADINKLNIIDINDANDGNLQMIVSAINEKGLPIKNLSPANFQIFIDSDEITDFIIQPISSNNNPLSVILSIDVSGSMRGEAIKMAKKSALTFIEQLNKDDFVSIMIFGSGVRFLTDFTRNRSELRQHIEGISANDSLTWLYQATHEATNKALTAPGSRVAIILLSDGKDEGSPLMQNDVIERIRQTNSPFFTIGFGQNAEVEYLRRISALSKGYFFLTPLSTDFPWIYDMVLKQLQNQYLIKFYMSKPKGNYNCILKLKHLGLETYARKKFSYNYEGFNPQKISKEGLGSTVKLFMTTTIIFMIIVMVIVIVFLFKIFKSDKKQRISHQETPTIIMSFSGTTWLEIIGDSLISEMKEGAIKLLPKKEGGFFTYSLCDRKNQYNIQELILSRYDNQLSRLYSKKYIYLLFANQTISRPKEDPYNKRSGHARIFLDKSSRYRVEDIGSSSGTELNNVLLCKGDAPFLNDKDEIKLGDIIIKFYETVS